MQIITISRTIKKSIINAMQWYKKIYTSRCPSCICTTFKMNHFLALRVSIFLLPFYSIRDCSILYHSPTTNKAIDFSLNRFFIAFIESMLFPSIIKLSANQYLIFFYITLTILYIIRIARIAVLSVNPLSHIFHYTHLQS